MVAASLGMAGLYVQNPKQFWTSVNTVTSHYQYLKPVGSNIIWPDFQVFLLTISEIANSCKPKKNIRKQIHAIKLRILSGFAWF